jgi:hypothetical protein
MPGGRYETPCPSTSACPREALINSALSKETADCEPLVRRGLALIFTDFVTGNQRNPRAIFKNLI